MDTTLVGQTMDRALDMVDKPRQMLDSSYTSSNFNLNNNSRQIRFEEPIDAGSDREKQRELTEQREKEMLEARKHR